MSEITILPIKRLELAFAPRPWLFASERRGEIDAHFAALQRANPALWNGRILMLHEYAIRGAVFHGSYLETDFASMMAWRHWDFPDAYVRNCFAMGALQASDGAFLLGVMGAHTSSPGMIYFPAGLPDLSDIDGARVDLDDGHARRIRAEQPAGQSARISTFALRGRGAPRQGGPFDLEPRPALRRKRDYSPGRPHRVFLADRSPSR